ncbi:MULTISPECIES: bifunctional methylenetetrahydrofolate dehydrogenase/methenyltetrahydrofolate cyclohydrolase FolD [Rhodomicrobium]|uniref:bifunctional methylenetetrahydrofolate dehydrogenase/methenyltetrahydrofolate cyclohydrolase FolD n=1 Tax=Rhodomicrobium TaxID=1068 RepID=UPI000B4B96DB|nr:MULTISPECIES: bifunctional methylenetetrahydrofolate dehydrogenase/methenyltetrahydrofolate cyclohydrolase FolD [Rhodomicrobium]
MADATIIDGKAIAARLRHRVEQLAAAFRTANGAAPGLAVVLAGDDPASQVYVASKVRTTEEAGMRSYEHRLPAEVGEAELLALVDRLNADPEVDGILVQLPLPIQIDASKVIARISPDKDVDGLHPVNVAKLSSGLPGLVPCTPLGCIILAKSVVPVLTGLDAVVVGRSILVGKPVAQLLLAENATVTMAHSRSRDLPGIIRRADLVVAAVGRPEMIRGDWIKPGATVIDVGINRIAAPEKGEGKTRLVGDVNFAEARQVAGAITPVPGGVGPMTVACLLANTLRAASLRRGLPAPDFEGLV